MLNDISYDNGRMTFPKTVNLLAPTFEVHIYLTVHVSVMAVCIVAALQIKEKLCATVCIFITVHACIEENTVSAVS